MRPSVLGGTMQVGFRAGVTVIALAGILASLWTWPTSAQQYLSGTNVQPVGQTTVRVCNVSQKPAAVAAVYVVSGQQGLRDRGWWRVEPGTCQDLFETAGEFAYTYAVNASDPSDRWGLNAAMSLQDGCINTPPQSFDFQIFAGGTQQTCPSGMAAVIFSGALIKRGETLVTVTLG